MFKRKVASVMKVVGNIKKLPCDEGQGKNSHHLYDRISFTIGATFFFTLLNKFCL
jgi:hypothetical protein